MPMWRQGMHDAPGSRFLRVSDVPLRSRRVFPLREMPGATMVRMNTGGSAKAPGHGAVLNLDCSMQCPGVLS